jgi:dihydroanticapsin dehydrogenase
MDMRLRDRAVLITGGASGIGRACVEAMIAESAKVMIVDRNNYPRIRVNCLCPGIVDTPMSRADLGFPRGFDGVDFPVMPAHQVARHAVFLASPVSAPINGTSLVGISALSRARHCR